MAISQTMSNMEPFIMKHFGPLWRERFKSMGFKDVDEWSDEKLKAVVHAYAESQGCPTCGEVK